MSHRPIRDRRPILSRALWLSLVLVTLLLALTACAPPPPQEAPKASQQQPAAQPQAPAKAPAAQQQPPAAQPQAPAAQQQPPAAAPKQEQPAAQPPAAVPAKFNEAPSLAAMVKDNKIPAVDQRLPKTPMVLKPIDKVGKYGGTWRTGLVGGQDTAWMTRTIGNENLVRWDPDWKTVIPNIAESFEANKEATEFTFKLREGMKWSDGKPFTADDIVFWYEEYLLNSELNPGGVAEWLRAAGKPVTVEKVNATTVKFKFAGPNGLFLQRLATPEGDQPTRYPKHYLQQFHKKYNTTNLDQLIKDNNAETWVKLFQLKGSSVPGTPYDAQWQNKDLPTLKGWILTTPYGGQTTRVVAERNPFFWKVDTAGNQLPYIDRVVYDVVQDREVLVLKGANGELDMQTRHIATFTNKPVFVDNQKKGDYRFIETVPSSMNEVIIALNLTHKDATKRKIFQNKDFRIGLSHAINRQEIIDLVFVSQGEPWQAAPRKQSPFYNEKLAKQYTEYSVAKANEHLDKAGFTQKDGEGFRLGPDGKRISITVEVVTDQTARVDTLKLVQKYWKAVGVDMQIKTEDRALLYTRKDSNEHDAAVWGGDGGLDVILEPRWYFPFSSESLFGQAWRVFWNPGGNPLTAPEEPPAPTRKQQQLYDQIKSTGDPALQDKLMREILDIAADQFYVIGIVLPPPGYGIVKNSMKNVPASMPDAWLYPNPAPTNPVQYYFES